MIRRSHHSAKSAGLLDDPRGVAATEFALIAPVFLIALMGVFDLGHMMFTNALLEGAIQKAARNSTIQGATPAQIDARLVDVVDDIVPGAQIQFSRSAYSNFSDVSQPEDYTDVDGDGACNNGEPFEDANGNGQWDSDRGRSGIGGARDAVLYKVTVSYLRVFPFASLVGASQNITTSAVTIVRNQPYNAQTQTLVTGNCL
jgi:Flp pilus assembly protein TadG